MQFVLWTNVGKALISFDDLRKFSVDDLRQLWKI